MILPPLKMYPPSEKWFLEKIQISKTVLISVVQFFYLFFGCPMTNFRSSLRKHLIHPISSPPPLPPQKKNRSGAQCFPNLWENLITQTSSFWRDRCYMLYIEWLQLLTKLGLCKLRTVYTKWWNFSYRCMKIKICHFFIDFGTYGLELQTSL